MTVSPKQTYALILSSLYIGIISGFATSSIDGRMTSHGILNRGFVHGRNWMKSNSFSSLNIQNHHYFSRTTSRRIPFAFQSTTSSARSDGEKITSDSYFSCHYDHHDYIIRSYIFYGFVELNLIFIPTK